MRPMTIEMEADYMREKTSKIPLERYEGEWKFKSYFPKNCKEEPTCRVDRINFTRDASNDNQNWNMFRTRVAKRG